MIKLSIVRTGTFRVGNTKIETRPTGTNMWDVFAVGTFAGANSGLWVEVPESLVGTLAFQPDLPCWQVSVVRGGKLRLESMVFRSDATDALKAVCNRNVQVSRSEPVIR